MSVPRISKTLYVGCAMVASSFSLGQKPFVIVVLKVDPPVKTKVTYRLDTKMIGESVKGEMGFSGSMSQTLTRKTKTELEWKTSFKVLSKYGRGAFAGAEKSFDDLDGTVMDLFMAPTGVMKKVRMEGIEVPSTGTPSVVFPAKPVSIGDTWPATMDMSGTKVNIQYSLASLSKVAGKQIALIQGKVASEQVVKNIEPIRFWVDVNTGLMQKAEAKLRITNQGQTIRLEYKINRQG